jgi:hypothetical protein
MNYSSRGLVVGTLLLLKILIRTPRFSVGLPNEKYEGDVEMMERQERQHRTAIQAGITFSARLIG